jgi:hypothetical protein
LFKLIFYLVIAYVAVNLIRFLSRVKIGPRIESNNTGNREKPYSKLDIQDAEFEDLDEK